MRNNQRSKWKDGQKVGVHQRTDGLVVDGLSFDQLVSGWLVVHSKACGVHSVPN